MFNTRHLKKTLILAFKIGLGSSLAIYIAQLLCLDSATSAGTITLLTLMTTKWQTIKLSGFRLLTFFLTTIIAWATFTHIDIVWISYGIFIFLTVFIAYFFGIVSTISVNSVIGAHLLITHDFSAHSIENELMLILIGIAIALILNLFQDNRTEKKKIIENMRYTEEKLQEILSKIAHYLMESETTFNVWDDIKDLEKKILQFQQEAYEYQDNTFRSHPEYFINYFEMRQNQTQMLHSLHYEIKKMRNIPKQASIVAEFIYYLKDYILEKNIPQNQIRELEDIFEWLKNEPLPTTREEFENRALLYHVLMDVEEFLLFKKRFIRDLSEEQIKEYWSNDY